MAADDIYHWKRSLAKNVEASIEVVDPVFPSVLSTVTIEIKWTERAVEGTSIATANNYTVTVGM